MKDVKKVIANNLVELRKKNKMTQIELAQKLNYSDKAVSRWENGEALPDIDILNQICEMYGVEFEYLLCEEDEKTKKKFSNARQNSNKIIISLLAISLVWFIATMMYVYAQIIYKQEYWIAFVWAVPVSFVIAIIFNCIWGKKINTIIFVSFLIWTLLASIYINFLSYNIWLIFIIGAPAQIAVVLWSQLSKK